MLGFLLEWVAAYYTREDSCSLARHQQLFADFRGAKRELNIPVPFKTPGRPTQPG